MTIAPAAITAIELAWAEKGRAHDVALKFRVTTNQVRRIWTIAKAEGRLPSIERRRGGYDFEAMLDEKTRSQDSLAIAPITKRATKADRLKEVA